ncbi:MAG: hypothetical protein QGI77_00320, partial [Roseibacillus sp.]|nr:hypothetical protein [Roseibacillus sp.]
AGTDPTNPDSDNDTLLDGVETNTGTFVDANDTGSDPLDFDSDDDSIGDGTEVASGFDPNDPASYPEISTANHRAERILYRRTDNLPEADFTGALPENIDQTAPFGTPDDPDSFILEAINVDQEPGSGGVDLLGDDHDLAFIFQFYDADGIFAFTENYDDRVKIVATPIGGSANLEASGASAQHTDVSWNTRSFANFDFGRGGWFNVDIWFSEDGGGAQSAADIGFGYYNDFSTNTANFGGVGYAATFGISSGAPADFDTDANGQSWGAYLDSFDPNLDSDGDSIPDGYEEQYFPGDLTQLGPGDFDADGLTDLEEYNAGTNPTEADPDDDGSNDPDEIANGTDPGNPDSDDDGLLDGVETNTGTFVSATDTGTNPLESDSDGDFYPDGQEVDNNTDPNDSDDPGAFAANLAHRYSFNSGAELVDSVGGNDGVLVGDAFVQDGQLHLDGNPTGPNADSMGFTDSVDLANNFGAVGVTFESWYTDDNSGSWAKLFSFGNGTGGSNIIFNLQQGGSGQGRIQYQGMPEANFGPRPALGEEHHLALTISPVGVINAWIDGAQIQASPPNLTGDGNDLATLPSSWERIGASNWGDVGMTGSVNEFRIWRGELTAEEVVVNLAGGPDIVGPATPFQITRVSYNSASDTVDITWNSVPGRFYTVEWSVDMKSGPVVWSEFIDITATGTSTTVTDTDIPPGTRMRYYRVLEWSDGPPRVILFSDDLESGAPGWTTLVDDALENTRWELGTPAGSTGPLAGADESASAWSTNIGDYGSGSNISLRSPAIDLGAAGSAELVFSVFRDADGFGDTAVVRFRRASDLVQLGAETAIDMSVFDDDYESVSIPVVPEAIGENVVVEWNFVSDATADAFSGLTIDNIEIVE